MLTLAQTGLFRARWSEYVHEEWMRAVVAKRPDIAMEQLQKTRLAMDNAVLDCLVGGYEGLIASLSLPDRNDRAILAAAIVARASVIVTFNQKDFPQEALAPFGIHTRHPDEFILDVESLDEIAFLDAVTLDLNHYAAPPISLDDYAEQLRKAGAPRTADHLLKLRILLEYGE